ncbi:hypothetical protein BYT27DRAFT_6520267 [Phlegmacium glaucopus]|nr:hypothetical protein BYT27DRAFT_6520267 [Phlegmacium glaucopus]
MHSTSISLFLIVVSLASTSLGLHHLVITARSSLEVILPRQTTSGPCTSICQPVQTTVMNCATADCLCTTAVFESLQTCINCAVSADPSVTVVSAAQSLIDSFASTCATVTGLPSVTISGTSTPSASTRPLTSTPGAPTQPLTVPTTIVQTTIRPSSISSATSSSSVSNAGSSSAGGLTLPTGNASSRGVALHWTGALLGLAGALLGMAAGGLLIF